ncbi:putative cop9 signalosome complex subunit 3 protein [Phaeoacremonium minimum UCRPA7]|uniref:Putative cop9 signalosome complex subunit 3 protein n=1 Tax=Phaeoacremonium minimum (strain UCR-PA7) TaxID=1286976 RepID=R8BKR6_PHAM7|nr:putative cop9 signalosome complex subunit 3 protein [Phaeoacremonium minimum UCRPA7]EON99884.1 putative cop9 signalosome complex subunit 3 protein [Phaeoacremonium minimum UCRPA7]
MDHAAATLLAFPPEDGPTSNEQYDKTIHQYLKRVNRLFEEKTSVVATHAVQLLELLTPATHSVAYLVILDVLINQTGQAGLPSDELVDHILRFLLTFDPRQIRYCGSSFSTLLNRVGNGLVFPHSIAVDVLAKALLRLDPTGSILTSHHIALTKLAYQTDNIEPAFKVIEKSIVYYPGMSKKQEPKYLSDMTLPPPSYISKETGLTTNLQVTQVLEYDLLCGMMYCSAKQWEKASAAFERVLSYPTRDQGVSKIMVEAHNKWILVNLLLSGRTPSLPAYTSPAARRHYETLGKPYTMIGSHFDSLDAAALKIEAEQNLQRWQDDGNFGLMREVLAAHQQWQIINLRDVYSKISISDIRARTRSAETGESLEIDEEVEVLINNMIASGMLEGTIEKPGGSPAYLKFLQSSNELTEDEFSAELLVTAQKIKDLQPVLKATNERLSTSKEYVRHLIKEQKREKENAGRDAAIGFDAQIEDEDLMGGLLPGQ